MKLLTEFIHILEDFRRVLAGFHFFVDLRNGSVGTDEETAAQRAHVFFAVHRFLGPHAVGFHRFFLFIGQKRERQREFVREFPVARDTVRADAYDGETLRRECRQVVPKRTCFLGAAGRIVLRIEIDKQPTSCVFIQRMNVSVLVGQREGRGLGIGFKHVPIIQDACDRFGNYADFVNDCSVRSE